MATCGEPTHYGYGATDGPHTWSLTWPAAAGAKQSPINIIRQKCIYDSTLTPFGLNLRHDCCQVFVREEHNFQVSFRGGEGPQLEGGPLKNRYILQQFHCHWGYADEWGSEHQIDGQCFSGELHLVFLNEKYSSVEQALDDAEGICVIGVFLQASNSECESMRPLIAAIKSSKPGSEQLIEDAIDIPSMIATTERYFTYEGSLTTPPCAECVRWIICAEPLKLSSDQLSAMRSMHSCETCYTSETFRPPLPVGKREIFCSFPQK